MQGYSFIVTAPHPIVTKNPVVMLDEGRNVFTAVVPDLDGFMQALLDEGATVQEANPLGVVDGQ